MKILEAKSIRKSFGETEVLKDISIGVDKGEVLAIIGPSGSGKSTLLRCVTQLEKVDSGDITICGNILTKNGVYSDKATRAKAALCVGLVFQNFNLFPHFTVLKNITDAQVKVLHRSKKEAESKALELLKKVGLEERANAYPSQLSGGQQQRVAIARALAMDPEVLFFDEPTSALDPELTGEILKVIKELASQHTTMVIVTHEMKFAHDVADVVMFMDNGFVIEYDTPENVFASTNPRTKEFLKRYYE